MKSPLFSVFIVASVMVAIAHCLPPAQRDREDSSEENSGVDTVLVLPNRRFPFSGASFPDLSSSNDDDYSSDSSFGINFDPFSYNPMSGFLKSMQDAMNRIREQMAGVLSGIPGQGSFAPWGQIPEGGNTTSTTKIIDGHVVTVNETTYQNADSDGSTVFRVRVVDIQPVNQTVAGNDGSEDVGGEEIDTAISGDREETTTQARSVETVEEFDNRIPNRSIDDNLTA